MNISDVVQVFVLIFILVSAGLYFTSRFWSPLLSKVALLLGFAPPPSAAIATPASSVDGSAAVSYSFRPGAPRPPRLRQPPVLADDGPEARLAYCGRLSSATRLVAYVAAGSQKGFPAGLYREWHEARWNAYRGDPAVGSEQAVAEDLRVTIEDDAAFAVTMAGFEAAATYAEMADLVHFCGEAFVASKAGSAAHARIAALAERLAVAVWCESSDPTATEEHDRVMLERKLEVDYIPEIPAKVAHLRRMHAFFRLRLVGLRDDAAAERRPERMADCRRHMEEHERLLGCFASHP